MKRYLWLLIPLIFVTLGCGLTVNQLEAEKAYYQAMIAIQKDQAARPLVELTPQDPDKPITLSNVAKFTVYAPALPHQEMRQYTHINYDEVWARALLGMTGIVAPMWGAIEITKAVTGMATTGTTTYNLSGAGNTLKTAGNTTVGGAVTGNGNQIAGILDQTGTPTVVNQPAPVIVTQPDPVIVNPVVVPTP